MDDITLEAALKLFEFPKHIGEYENMPLVIGQGRFGPYIKWGETYVSIPRDTDPQSIDTEEAIRLVEEKKQADAPLGIYDGEPYTRGKGRFGPYLKWKNLYVSIPRAIDPETITHEEAEKLIATKVEKEANRYIHNWTDAGISVENGRYGAYIKFGKKNFYLKRDGAKITDADTIAKLTLDDVKAIILEQDPDAFGKKKAGAKKATTSKITKKTTGKKKKKS